MKWLIDGPMCTFDVESTGVSVVNDRIVTASLVWVEPGKQPTIETWLVNPGVEIPAEAQAVHGVSTERAMAEGVEPAGALDQICASLAWAVTNGVPVVAFNAAFDLTILDRDARRNDVQPLVERVDSVAPVVDPYVIDKHADPYRKGTRRLSDPKEGGLCEWYGAKMDGAHDSTFDALAAARVAWRIAAMTQWPNMRLVAHYADPRRAHRYGNRHRPQDIADKFLALALSTPAQLHTAQVGWKAEQSAGLRAYFEKQGKDISDIHEAWPMVPFKEEQ